MIEILSSSALSTVQDLGRAGNLRFGVGTAGAMDRLALMVGNMMVGNPREAAGIEVPLLPFQVRFLSDLDFAVTGADCVATLDGKALLPWWTCRASAGQVLTLGAPGSGFSSGARSYLLVTGGVDVPQVLGSRSTQLRGQFGGHQGRALQKGDRLPCAALDPSKHQSPLSQRGDGGMGFGVVPPEVSLPDSAFLEQPDTNAGQLTAMRVLPAAEYEDFDAASVQAFWATDWKISAQSDRYGYRLAGPALALKTAAEIRSHGIVPGVIQVPNGGQPIIQMRDAQPSGGYPKIGTVIEADLWRLGQAPAGSRIRFVPSSYPAAVAALRTVNDYLGKVEQLIALYRNMNA